MHVLFRVNAHLPCTVFFKDLSSKGLSIDQQEARVVYKNYRTIGFARMISGEIGGFVTPNSYEQQLRVAARINSAD